MLATNREADPNAQAPNANELWEAGIPEEMAPGHDAPFPPRRKSIALTVR